MQILCIIAFLLWGTVFSFVNEEPRETDDTSYIIRNWDISDGLPINAVASIIQDDEGYLWVTSYDGLSRFDGHAFKVFNSSNLPGIQSNRFHSSIRDSSGNIWFYPEYNGVMRYSSGDFTFYDEENGFDGEVITTFPDIINGQAYFPTTNGFYTFSDGEFQAVYTAEHPEDSFIQDFSHYGDYIVLSTAEGLVVLKNGIKQRIIPLENKSDAHYSRSAIFNGLIYAVSDNKLKIFDLQGNPQELSEQLTGNVNIIRAMATDEYLFLTTDNGLCVFTAAQPLTPKWRFPDFEDIILDVYTDRNQTIWLKVTGGKYYHFKNGEMSRFNPQRMLDDFRLSHVFEDQEGITWLGSDNKGLIRINESMVETVGMADGLTDENMLGVFKDSENNIWTGVRMNGINIIDSDGQTTSLSTFEGIPLRDVNAIAEGPDGSIFFHLRYKGLGRIYPDGRREIIHFGNDSVTTRVTAIRFRENRIFTATHGGLFIHDLSGRQINHFGISDGLESEAINNMKLTPEGDVWLTTINGGVSHIEISSGRVTTYTDEDGLALNSVRGLYIDRDDPETIWFGTEGNGISRLKDGRFSSVNSASGLFDDQIHSIVEDDFGKLWMSTNRGVFYVNKQELNTYLDGNGKYITSVAFGRNHGMLNEECNGGSANSVFLDDEGHLHYPTQAGIAIFNTNDPRLRPEASPEPNIEMLTINGESISLDEPVELEPGLHDFTVSFTAFNYSAPERIHFMYKLEGYDKEWIYAGKQRSATYTNLPPKDYRFLVKASTNQFHDELDYAEATISLLPHFYQQWWFYLLAGLSGIGGILFLHRMRMYQAEVREQRLQQIVYLRTKALTKEKDSAMRQQKVIAQQADELRRMNQTKDRFFNIIAHDLKGPIAGIKGITNLLDEDYDTLTTEERKEFIGCANKSTEFVYKLLINLLDWARIQSNHSKPKVCTLDAEKAVYEALNVLKPLADTKKVELKTSFRNVPSVQADRNMLDTILRNFISNAIKFSFPKSEIGISVYVKNNKVCFSVKDSGVGITEEDQKKLFRPDMSMSRPGTSQELGTGLGLLLCIDMANVLGGHISLKSKHGEGSEFTLCLPLADSDTQNAQNGEEEQQMSGFSETDTHS